MTAPIRVAFVCVQNAGRSQMATAFAEREIVARGLADRIEVYTGGTQPADHVHDEVVETMAAVEIDLADRDPHEITTAELEMCDYVATMGCSTLDIDPARDVDVRDWALDDPDGKDPAEVAAIRDEVERRVIELLDEIEAHAVDASRP